MIVLAPDFITKICKKAAQDFHRAVLKVFDRVKSVALWSANIRKLAKDHKGYGSAAILKGRQFVTFFPHLLKGDNFIFQIPICCTLI